MSVEIDNIDRELRIHTQGISESKEIRYKRSIYRWRRFSLILSLAILAVIVATIIAVMVKEEMMKTPNCQSKYGVVDLGEPKNPSVFHDLTKTEIRGIRKYLFSLAALNLTEPSKAMVDTSYIYLAELYLPPKMDVLEYLGKSRGQPKREAIVTIFRGDKRFPCIEEYRVGPLPDPQYYSNINGRRNCINFNVRPSTIPELKEALTKITDIVHEEADSILYQTFGGKLKNCKRECMSFKTMTPVSPAVTKLNARKIWFWLTRSIEYFALHPVDFAVLVNINRRNYTIEDVWYQGQNFKTLRIFVDSINRRGKINQNRNNIEENKDFSKLYLRKSPFPDKPLRNPIQVEPDGKRYTIIGQNVQYMNWVFDFRMSSIHGPQLYNIRYRNDMIIYELGLQEIAVFHSGRVPYFKFADYLGTFSLIGAQAKSLILGSDCPSHSTLISSIHFLESSRDATEFKNAFCLFEHNNGEPIRRHHSYSSRYGRFYEGMESVVLVLRTIVTIVNYDYLFDFIFYQNGVVQVKVVLTGYLLPSPNEEEESGYTIHDNIKGNIHFHTFNFKVDLDINGQQNRFQTLNLELKKERNIYSKHKNESDYYFQTQFSTRFYTHERDALYKYNFSTPKHLLVYNHHAQNHYKKPKAYRILIKGTDKQLLPEAEGIESSASWARYQLAITKYKEDERHSSSMYATYDAQDPVVQFKTFIEDDEQIVDEDLVAWVTLGLHHIPHTEDLPVTHTPGNDVSFYLLPFNYFPESPAMASRNAIRIDPKNINNNSSSSGVKIDRYGIQNGLNCVPFASKFKDENIADSNMFETDETDITAI